MNFITIGTFDGVHNGHKQLMQTLKKMAAGANLTPVVMYMDMPPKIYFSGKCDNCLLTLPWEREALIKQQGIEKTIKINFNKEFAAIDKDGFFSLLLNKYKMKGLLVGRDFAFGKNRDGNLEYLRKMCVLHNVELKILDFFTDGDHKISSSLIRRLLTDGKIEQANLLLGYNYFINGKVIKGRQLARTLGWPTANVKVDAFKFVPKGIFASVAKTGNQSFASVSSIGVRPTVETDGALLLESHLLNFNRDIYGQTFKAELISKLRPEHKFPSLDALKAQVNEDIKQASGILKQKHLP